MKERLLRQFRSVAAINILTFLAILCAIVVPLA